MRNEEGDFKFMTHADIILEEKIQDCYIQIEGMTSFFKMHVSLSSCFRPILFLTYENIEVFK